MGPIQTNWKDMMITDGQVYEWNIPRTAGEVSAFTGGRL